MRPRGRPLNDHERAIIEFALEHPSSRFEPLRRQLEHATVTGRSCGCGCASIDLRVDKAAAPRFNGHFESGADGRCFGTDANGNSVEVMVSVRDGYLGGLEIVTLGSDSGQLPAEDSLAFGIGERLFPLPPGAASEELRFVTVEYVSLRPNLPVRDVAAATGFYRSVVGLWTVVHEEPDGSFALLKEGGAELALVREPSPTPQSAYLYVKGVEALYESCRRGDIPILNPLTEHPYGVRDFVIEDLDGHRIAIGERL